MSYIVKNCPALYGIDDGFLCSDNNDEDEKYCIDCTDCVIKQVIEKCKDMASDRDFYAYDFANEILKLFDIEEVK